MKISYRRLLPAPWRRWLRSLIVECGDARCRGFHLSHPLLRRLPGIYLDQGWYCSPDCLRDALKHRVGAQFGAAITDLRNAPRMPFRLILLAKGIVSEEQLAHARYIQAEGEDLGDALVALGYATEEGVAAARAEETGSPFFGGAAQPVLPACRLPLSLMQLYRAAPVHYSPATGRLLVGFVYRVNHSLLQAVEQVTGYRVAACIMTNSAWVRQQQLADQLAPGFEEVNAVASSQDYITSLIVEHAIESGADKVRMGLSSTAIWARLTGGSRSRDLVIDLDRTNSEEFSVTLAEVAAALGRGRAGLEADEAKRAVSRLKRRA